MSLRPATLAALAVCLVLAAPFGCGESFEEGGGAAGGGAAAAGGAGGSSSAGAGGSSSGAGAGGSSSGAGGGGGSGGSSSSSGAGGGAGGLPVPASCGAGSLPASPSLYTTLDDDGATLAPWLGDGAGAQYGSAAGFVATPDGFGLALQGAPERLSYRQKVNGYVNFDPESGAVDFCYKPAYHHTDDADHMILWWQLGGPDHLITVRKAGGSNNNEIHANIDSPNQGLRQVIVDPADYALQPGQWVRLTMAWQLTGASSNFFELWLDGNQLNTSVQPTTLAGVNVPGPAEMALVAAGARLPVGNWGADGVIDELRFYDEPVVP